MDDQAGAIIRDGSSRSFAAALQRVATGQLFPFLACAAGSFLIFFFRNPDPWFNPTLYAEDGQYITLAYSRGFWAGLSAARADYFVFANFSLTWLCVQICRAFFDNNVLVLPQIIAIVSYAFFGATVSLPVLLLRSCFRLRYLLALWLASSFFPLEQFDNEVLGRLSNVGFAFLYIALLLIWYRNNVARSIWGFLLVDLGLLACAATNPLVLPILPLTGLRYLRARIRHGEPLRGLVLRKDLLCLCLLAAACLPIAHRKATVHQQGMPDAPLLWDNVVEMALARNFLYPLVHPFYGELDHSLVIGLFTAAVAALLVFHDRRHRELYLAGLLILTLVVVSTLATRRWMLPHIAGYRPSLVCRYFYAQGLIVLLLAVRLGADIMERRQLPRWMRALPLGLLLLFFVGLDRQSSYGFPESPLHQLRELGSLERRLTRAVDECWFVDAAGRPDPEGDYVRVRIYPLDSPWYTMLPRESVEESLPPSTMKIAVRPTDHAAHH